MSPRPTPGPVVPRIPAPDVPPMLEHLDALARHDDVLGVLLTLGGTRDAAHARIAESVLAAEGDVLDIEGATLVDVSVEEPRLVELRAPRSHWRTVRVEGGRLGTLDLAGAELDGVELRGIRIDYLSLAQARVRDLLVVDCVLGTVDVPLAELERVRFEGCRADEVDTRELRAKDLDLRGLDALSYTDPSALRGATMAKEQAVWLAAELALALGILLS